MAARSLWLVRGVLLAAACLLLGAGYAAAQGEVRIHGAVRDSVGVGLPGVSVVETALGIGTMTGGRGEYSLYIPVVDSIRLAYSSLGFETRDTLILLGGRRDILVDLQLYESEFQIGTVKVVGNARPSTTVERVLLPSAIALPSAGASVESLLKTLPGVQGANELSSQYSVRGGAFDENLVYIDGMEVYRPSLIRGGNQEGLSIINPDMVSRVEFSAGAFPANLGDRMSSALNIEYRVPRTFRAKVDFGLLESRLLVEGAAMGGRLSSMLGVRYKSTRLLLNTTDVQGDYRPSFFDLQSKTTLDLPNEVQVGCLVGYMRNAYDFRPVKKETTFGSMASAFQTLKVYYEGGERDLYSTFFANAYARWTPSDTWEGTAQVSLYRTDEHETFDILGEYWLQDVRRSDEKVDFNDSLANRGIGGSHDHARNAFGVMAGTASAVLRYRGERMEVEGGLEASQLLMYHNLNEWHLLDSAGYTLPLDPLQIEPLDRVRAKANFSPFRLGIYGVGKYRAELWGWDVDLTAGARLTSRARLRDMRFSPRASVEFVPQLYPQLSAYFGTGVYYQYPFYREMRDRRGGLHLGIPPQRSLHFVLGTRISFPLAIYPCNVQVEAYRKELSGLIPYTVENLSIRYEGEPAAEGHITGLELKVNATLVPGVESWFSLSVMKAQMRMTKALSREGVNPTGEGYFAMPTDQRFSASLFLQDYFPWWPSFRVHLAGSFATGLPFTPPGAPYGVVGRLPSYQRVDIGFTKVFKGDDHTDSWMRWATWLRDWSVSAEVLNLFNYLNTTSYMWVTVPTDTGQSTRLAVPNYLTARCVNVRLVLGF